MAAKKASSAVPAAPYGWDLVGEDGRRILRWESRSACEALAASITSRTAETLEIVPATISALSAAAGAAGAAEEAE